MNAMSNLSNPFLLFCPFCGCEDIEILYGKEAIRCEEYFPQERGGVRCSRCGMGSRVHPRVELAVRKWNGRFGL